MSYLRILINAFWILCWPAGDDQNSCCCGGCGFGFGCLGGVGGGSFLDGMLMNVTSAIVGVADGGIAMMVEALLSCDDVVAVGLGGARWNDELVHMSSNGLCSGTLIDVVAAVFGFDPGGALIWNPPALYCGALVGCGGVLCESAAACGACRVVVSVFWISSGGGGRFDEIGVGAVAYGGIIGGCLKGGGLNNVVVGGLLELWCMAVLLGPPRGDSSYR